MRKNLEAIYKKAKKRWDREFNEFKTNFRMTKLEKKIKNEIWKNYKELNKDRGEDLSLSVATDQMDEEIKIAKKELSSDLQEEEVMKKESKESLKTFATKRQAKTQNKKGAKRIANLPRTDAPCVTGGYDWKDDGCKEDAFEKLFSNNQDEFVSRPHIVDEELKVMSFMRVDLESLKNAFTIWKDEGDQAEKNRLKSQYE